MDQPGGMEQSAHVASAIRDGRARIVWGESVDDVRAAMIEGGVEPEFAETVIKAALKERGAEIRVQGAKDLILGVVIFFAGLVPLVLMLVAALPSMMLMAGASLGVAYGGFRIVRGLIRLVAGSKAAGDVSDL